MEKLFEPSEKIHIQQKIDPTRIKYNKNHFNRAIQELTINKIPVSLSPSTIQGFNDIFNFVSIKLNANKPKQNHKL